MDATMFSYPSSGVCMPTTSHESSNAEMLSMLDELRDRVERRSRGTVGVSATSVPDLNVARLTCAGDTDHCLERPLVSIILQGRKHVTCGFRDSSGAREFTLVPGNSSLVALDMPLSSTFLDSSPEMPFLGVFAYLDRSILLDLILKMPQPSTRELLTDDELDGVVVDTVDEDLLSCMLRLARLWDRPEQIAVRAPIIMQELHYVVLAGTFGPVLRSLYRRNSQNGAVIRAIALLKKNLSEPLRVDELARQVNMSVSSLHRHFKQLTGSSPLQYRKQLRLLETRRLMFTEHEQAATAAMMVGYDSVTQFNREYKRMFGEPPLRDMRRLQTF